MNIVEAKKENIKKAAAIIKAGGLVAFPTETVYGLGANGLNPIAAAKIFEVKNRPSFNPLIMHIAKVNELEKLCYINNPKINLLVEKFLPGPLTLVLPKKDIVPEIVTADNPTVAVRMPSHEAALELIKESGCPIAAPSANLFNRLSPTTAKHVYEQLGDSVDLILDGGTSEVGVESTIIEVIDNKAYLLRPGGIPVEEIEETLEIKLDKKEDEYRPNSPGQLPYHYSPITPLKFIEPLVLNKEKGKRVGALLFNENNYDFEFEKVKFLSVTGDLREAAANLFSRLHELEKESLDLILVEKIEEKGLGIAIMDRLKKAAARFSR